MANNYDTKHKNKHEHHAEYNPIFSQQASTIDDIKYSVMEYMREKENMSQAEILVESADRFRF